MLNVGDPGDIAAAELIPGCADSRQHFLFGPMQLGCLPCKV